MIRFLAELELAPLIRAIIIYLSLLTAFVVIGVLSKPASLDWKKTVPISIAGLFFMILCALPNSFAFGGISGDDWLLDILLVPLTMIHGLSFYAFASVPLCKCFSVDHRKLNDISAVAFILCQGLAHFGCVFYGCCKGYQTDFGIYNRLTGDVRFPVQIIDGVACILISVSLFLYLKKREYKTGGVLYPIMLISYGTVRALLELMRDNEKILGPFSFNTIHCFVMIGVGVAYFFIIRAYNKERELLRLERNKTPRGRKK